MIFNQGADGLICVKTNMSILFAKYNKDMRAENTNNVVESLGEYLRSMNYWALVGEGNFLAETFGIVYFVASWLMCIYVQIQNIPAHFLGNMDASSLYICIPFFLCVHRPSFFFFVFIHKQWRTLIFLSFLAIIFFHTFWKRQHIFGFRFLA